jgi:hypothetical protein
MTLWGFEKPHADAKLALGWLKYDPSILKGILNANEGFDLPRYWAVFGFEAPNCDQSNIRVAR